MYLYLLLKKYNKSIINLLIIYIINLYSMYINISININSKNANITIIYYVVYKSFKSSQ